MSVVSEVEQESEPDDKPLVEPLAATTEGAPHKYLIAFAVVLAALMQVIDSSIVNVALPDMMGNLGASLDEIAWVSTGYILASVIIIPLTGWLGEFFGRKRYFVGSIIIFTIASFLCGASHSLGALVSLASRTRPWRRCVDDRLAGSAVRVLPAQGSGTAMALFGLGVMVGPTIGPTPRRVAHRQLRVAVDFLRQSSRGCARGGDDYRLWHDPEYQRRRPLSTTWESRSSR
jgi:DHA2 family multidrug resistance protein